jgi:hypothetical protein
VKKKLILASLVATAAIAAPLVGAPAASAATPSGSACTPSAATTAVTHTEYQWAALVSKGGLHWEYKWTATPKNPSTDILHVWVKSVDLTNRGLPQITRTVVDTPATGAVTCSVTLPEHFVGEGTYSVVVPYVKGVDTFLMGVQGYDEHVAITHDVTVTKAMAGQFWIGHTAQPGYVIANPTTAQWHIDFQFANDDSAPYEVRFSDTSGKHINLPDVFDIEHTEYPEGTYWSTQVRVNVVNDTDTDQEFRIRYADVQDGDRVWVQGTRFTDGLPNNVVPAHSSRPLVLDVWHNVVSGADVPDDLTLDFGFELA